ncbi:hypothetical protein GWK08_01295 [Leptobacterium flavescens]|uniref:Uncharacterized protein n=1 Tax=Leptobacterium flavescens TaxID=472055 RepID=A0A6P0ULX5_9FLAO|nr:hypothetical protein [Leptobacterium flavescens]NER12063.1 hypothetical protein [Leptobacterium flavescens]
MKAFFEDLYPFELVLLFLGVFLFLILCAGLIYYIVKKSEIKRLLMFFPIPIIMIAYPSIKEIQIGDYKIAMKEYKQRLLENPEDKEAEEKLREVTEKLEKRASTSEDIKAVSVANLLLGNSEKVIDLTNKAIEKDAAKSNTLSVDGSDTAANTKDNQAVHTLMEINKLASIQEELNRDSTALRDTVLLKRQIQKIEWENPEIRNYLNRKITTKYRSNQ